ncbi:MAG: hypothetical protein RBG13Loki_1177 [Promethearchaeota archaeon CR_4]|nr:MAG: hypothetical protein RBG13Loki_1177 [Candidatus Lokiarchaeota archaeon CR_4]
MTKEKIGIYATAGVVRDEAFFDSQLQMAGSGQSRVLEKLQKNKNTMKNQALMVKIVYSVLLGIIPILPIMTFIELEDKILSFENLALSSVVILVLYFGLTTLYMILIGIINLSGFMSGEVFEWLEILPLSRRSLQKVEFTVMWRFFDIPFIVVVVVFPVLMLLVTGNILVFFVCLGASVLTTIFLFCIIVLLTEKFSRIMKGSGTNSRKASVIRTLAMLGYAIASISASLIISQVMNNIGAIINSINMIDNAGTINIVLSVIPFPFAPAYLISLMMSPITSISPPLLWTTLLGFGILILLTWLMYRLVLKKLRNLTSHQGRIESLTPQKSTQPTEIRPIVPVSPVKAFTRKDISSLTRDFQGFLFILFPLIFPFIMFLQAPTGTSVGEDTMFLFGFLLVFAIMITVMNSGWLVSALLSMEDSGASILASLPVVPRDQVTAKLKIICTLQLVSSLLPLVIFAGDPQIFLLLQLFLGYCPLGMAIVLLTFALKIRLFGKMRYKYVLEEANPNRKALKWVAMLGLDTVILLGILYLVFSVGDIVGSVGMIVILAGSGGIGLLVVRWLINLMCPKMTTPKSIEVLPA